MIAAIAVAAMTAAVISVAVVLMISNDISALPSAFD